MLCKLRGLGSGEQDVRCVLHDQTGGGNRMEDAFDRSDRTSSELRPFHDRGIHPLHPVQLTIRTSSRIEQTRVLQETNRTFDGDDGWTSLLKDGITDDERIGQAGGLRRRQPSETGASMGKNERRGIGQLRSRSRACRYAGSFMRSRSDRTNPRPVTQSSKLSESFRNKGGSSPDGLSAICATIP